MVPISPFYFKRLNSIKREHRIYSDALQLKSTHYILYELDNFCYQKIQNFQSSLVKSQHYLVSHCDFLMVLFVHYFNFSLYIVPLCILHDYVFTEQMLYSFAAPNSMIHNQMSICFLYELNTFLVTWTLIKITC